MDAPDDQPRGCFSLIDLSLNAVQALFAALALLLGVLTCVLTYALADPSPPTPGDIVRGASVAICVKAPLLIFCAPANSILPNSGGQSGADDTGDESSDVPETPSSLSNQQLLDCDPDRLELPCLYTVEPNDSLASISKDLFGSENYANRICNRNR
jgi:hypothetical protein